MWVRDRQNDDLRVVAGVLAAGAAALGAALADDDIWWVVFVALICLTLAGRALSGVYVIGHHGLNISAFTVRVVNLDEAETIEIIDRRYGHLVALRGSGWVTTVRGVGLAWRNSQGAREMARRLEAALDDLGNPVSVHGPTGPRGSSTG